MEIVERKFRGSQICHLFGSPVAYGIVSFLLEKGYATLDEIARAAKRSKSATCTHLSKLRLAHIVRYDTKNGKTRYWVKYPDEVRSFMRRAEQMAVRASRRIDRDI